MGKKIIGVSDIALLGLVEDSGYATFWDTRNNKVFIRRVYHAGKQGFAYITYGREWYGLERMQKWERMA